MTDGQLLYLCLAGFYLAECLHWLPPGSISFRAWRLGSRWRRGRSALDFSLGGVRPHAASWAPTGGFFATMDWPVLPEKDGVRIGPRQEGCGRRSPWSDLNIGIQDRRLELRAGHAVVCASPAEARRWGHLLATISRAHDAERQELCDRWWRATTSLAGARRALRLRRVIQRQLGFPCWMVFALCFAVIPMVYWFVGWKGYALLMTTGLLLLQLVEITWRCSRLEKRLFRRTRGGRLVEAVQNLLLPVHAMKAAERLGACLAEGVHPVCLHRVLLPEGEALKHLSPWFREWVFIADPDPMKDAQPLWLPKIESWMKRLGLEPEELKRPPDDLPSSERYCPRCHTAYAASGLACADCGGIPTRSSGAA